MVVMLIIEVCSLRSWTITNARLNHNLNMIQVRQTLDLNVFINVLRRSFISFFHAETASKEFTSFRTLLSDHTRWQKPDHKPVFGYHFKYQPRHKSRLASYDLSNHWLHLESQQYTCWIACNCRFFKQFLLIFLTQHMAAHPGDLCLHLGSSNRLK